MRLSLNKACFSPSHFENNLKDKHYFRAQKLGSLDLTMIRTVKYILFYIPFFNLFTSLLNLISKSCTRLGLDDRLTR